MKAVNPLDDRSVRVGVDGEPVSHVDAFEYQHAAFELDLAFRVGPETTASGGDAARFERAPECASQSTSG